MPGKVPDRWEDYIPFKQPIKGTRFIALKVPLEQGICNRLPKEKWFTPDMLIKDLETSNYRLGLLVDLTNTKRYYKPSEIESHGVGYIKINTEGRVVPTPLVREKFRVIVDDFLERNVDNDLLIGVHCTHGLNRTGYMVCRYMIDQMRFTPKEAIEVFNEARGYAIERENYITDLMNTDRDVPLPVDNTSDGEIVEDEDSESGVTAFKPKAPGLEDSDSPTKPKPASETAGETSKPDGDFGGFRGNNRGGYVRGRGFQNRGGFNNRRPFNNRGFQNNYNRGRGYQNYGDGDQRGGYNRGRGFRGNWTPRGGGYNQQGGGYPGGYDDDDLDEDTEVIITKSERGTIIREERSASRGGGGGRGRGGTQSRGASRSWDDDRKRPYEGGSRSYQKDDSWGEEPRRKYAAWQEDGGHGEGGRGRGRGYGEDRYDSYRGKRGGFEDRRGRGSYGEDRRGGRGGYGEDRRGRGGYGEDRRGGRGGYGEDRRGGRGGGYGEDRFSRGGRGRGGGYEGSERRRDYEDKYTEPERKYTKERSYSPDSYGSRSYQQDSYRGRGGESRGGYKGDGGYKGESRGYKGESGRGSRGEGRGYRPAGRGEGYRGSRDEFDSAGPSAERGYYSGRGRSEARDYPPSEREVSATFSSEEDDDDSSDYRPRTRSSSAEDDRPRAFKARADSPDYREPSPVFRKKKFPRDDSPPDFESERSTGSFRSKGHFEDRGNFHDHERGRKSSRGSKMSRSFDIDQSPPAPRTRRVTPPAQYRDTEPSPPPFKRRDRSPGFHDDSPEPSYRGEDSYRRDFHSKGREEGSFRGRGRGEGYRGRGSFHKSRGGF